MRSILIILIIFHSSLLFSAEQIKEIRIVTEAWEDAANKDGTGLYFDVIRAVYKEEGIKLSYLIVPYSRSVLMVKEQSADAWLASFLDEENFALYPKWHFDTEPVSVMYKKETIKKWQREQSFENKNIAWIRGYGYGEYFTTSVKYNLIELSKRELAFGMLEKGRIDFFIDAEQDIQKAVEKEAFDISNYYIHNFTKLKLYLAFANNERGKQLCSIWDQRIEVLQKSEKLKKIYDKWNYTPYPYE